ncbi:MAG: hypothetical protein A2W25_09115 [candidate division Zixibacteria bacterium RBG_16_53_22]|nr:MAG: hypothetical protein A2W25_09115 [candidate division Zixibacteria bacterium RBG_16_53_22]
MKDRFYMKCLREEKSNLEKVIIQGLKPFKKVPINLAFRAFRIKMPTEMKNREITLGEFISQSGIR